MSLTMFVMCSSLSHPRQISLCVVWAGGCHAAPNAGYIWWGVATIASVCPCGPGEGLSGREGSDCILELGECTCTCFSETGMGSGLLLHCYPGSLHLNFLTLQAVDVVGQAGKPKAITGFQTHTTPVLLAHGERAELATEEYLPVTPILEGFVILRKNPNYDL